MMQIQIKLITAYISIFVLVSNSTVSRENMTVFVWNQWYLISVYSRISVGGISNRFLLFLLRRNVMKMRKQLTAQYNPYVCFSTLFFFCFNLDLKEECRCCRRSKVVELNCWSVSCFCSSSWWTCIDPLLLGSFSGHGVPGNSSSSLQRPKFIMHTINATVQKVLPFNAGFV